MLETKRRTPRKSNPSPKAVKQRRIKKATSQMEGIICHAKFSIERKQRTTRRRHQRNLFSILSALLIIFTISLCVFTLIIVTKTHTPQKPNNLPEYVSSSEYDAIDTGMTHDQVKSIIGNYGQLRFRTVYHGSKVEIYDWFAQNSATANVRIVFENNLVAAKKQIGLE
jgi:hypothetical protein